jgi:hypothetical protein
MKAQIALNTETQRHRVLIASQSEGSEKTQQSLCLCVKSPGLWVKKLALRLDVHICVYQCSSVVSIRGRYITKA